MQREGVSLNEDTFVSILDGCSDQDALAAGKKIHGRLIARGLESGGVVGTALVNMYSKCGSIEEALRIFCKFSKHDTVLWNAMIAAYAWHGQTRNALQFLEQMQQQGLMPDRITFMSVLEACVSQADLAAGKQMHAHICSTSSGFVLEADVGTALVNMYGKCGNLENSRGVFEIVSERNVPLWNAMIFMYSQNSRGRDALGIFEDMQQQGVMPDELTFVAVLDACASIEALFIGRCMHAVVIASRCDSEVVGRAIVNLYGKSGRLKEAQTVFESILKWDAATWLTMISCCVHHKKGRQVVKLFGLMQQEGVVPDKATHIAILDACASQADPIQGKRTHACLVGSGYELDVGVGNALVNMYAQCGCLEDARRMLDKMPGHNEVNFISILSACACRGAITEGRRIHACIKGTNFKSDAFVGMGLVNMYSKCGSLENAQGVFDKIPEQNLDLRNCMLAAYAHHGHGIDALKLFIKMREEEVMPDKATFSSLLLACSNSSLLEEGHRVFHSMDREYNITPDLDHYNSLISLLGRVGRLVEAEELINNMPFKPNAMSWMGLLRACWKQGDVERGELATQRLIEQHQDNAMSYIMLSNIYTAAGRQDDAEMVMVKMKLKGLKKLHGCTSIEVMGRVHEFLVNDQLHPQKEKIYAEVERLMQLMEAEGYVPDPKLGLHGLEEEHRLCRHSEELAMAFGLMRTPPKSSLLILKNLRVCPDCHSQAKFLSKILHRDIILRDSHSFHKMKDGGCSCGDYW